MTANGALSLGARRRAPALLLAGGVVAAVVGGLLLVPKPSSKEVDVSMADVAPAAFDRDVSPICRALLDGRPASPRVATPDAYAVLAQRAMATSVAARASLAGVRPPADDVGLVDRVTADLLRLEERARNVLDLSTVDRPDVIASAWSPVDEYFDIALDALAGHGADACRRFR